MHYPVTPLTDCGWPGLTVFRFCQTTRVYFMACVALRDINRIVWGLKMFLATGLAHLVSCASPCPLLMTQNCCFYLNGRLYLLWLYTQSHPYIDEIHDITGIEKTALKIRSTYIACRISYEI